jgi:beta-aspartyl-peptidase (threonine type)
MKKTPGIIVHGGAGRKLDMNAHRRGVRRAALAGYEVLSTGGSALDAVVAAVVVMEDDVTFNCGPDIRGKGGDGRCGDDR